MHSPIETEEDEITEPEFEEEISFIGRPLIDDANPYGLLIRETMVGDGFIVNKLNYVFTVIFILDT